MPDYSQYRLLPLERRSPLDARDFRHHPATALAPNEMVIVDLHNHPTLGDLLPPLRDQGQEGSCAGFATVELTNHLAIAARRDYPILAPAFTYFRARLVRGWQNQDSGSYERDDLQSLVSDGCCPESLMPYVAGQYAVAPTAAQMQAAQAYKLGSYAGIATMQDVLATLKGYQAAVMGSNWYSNWYNPPQGLLPAPVGAAVGAHEWLTCGATVINNVQKIRLHNSWGGSWGDGSGHAWVDASLFGSALYESWTGALPVIAPPTPPVPVTHGEAVATQAQARASVVANLVRGGNPADPRLAGVLQGFHTFATLLHELGVDVQQELAAVRRSL